MQLAVFAKNQTNEPNEIELFTNQERREVETQEVSDNSENPGQEEHYTLHMESICRTLIEY